MIAGAVAWVTALALLTALTLHAASGHISRYDTEIMDHIVGLPRFLQPLFYAEGFLGYSPVIALATVGLGAWLIVRKAPLEAALTFGAVLPFAAMILVKNLVKEQPPGHLLHPTHYHGWFTSNYSFPSGHVVAFTVLGGLAFAFAGRLSSSASAVVVIRVVCVFAIATVAIGRVYREAHYPSDTAAAYLLALLYLIPALLLWAWLCSRESSR